MSIANGYRLAVAPEIPRFARIKSQNSLACDE
jgi:hypothetical protein